MEDRSFRPYIPSSETPREFTFRAVVLGLFLGLFFAVANAYLALKIGTTISASIPAAIVSMAFFKTFFRNGTILENNLVQTIATVGEGLAAGALFTVPALILLGDSPSPWTIFLLSTLGGILGILLMIPMRRFLIVEEHHRLPYPEGTACAEILKAGAAAGKNAISALWGVLVSALYKLLMNGFFLWNEVQTWTFKMFRGAEISVDATPALLGVGYIIGARISLTMFAGGIIGWWVIIPLIKTFGMADVLVYPSRIPIDEMGSNAIWSNYVRYIGAGTLAFGGLYNLVRILPIFYRTLHLGFKELFSGFWNRKHLERTDRDISMAWLMIGTLAIALFAWLYPGFPMNFFTVALLIVLSFLFTAVTSIAAGLIGSTSNPVSGMTITTLLVTCLLFVQLGWTERIYLISAIMMGCVACCAICLAGTTSQDLKTGFLLGATPKHQQIAEILGIFLPAFSLGYTIYLLNGVYEIGSTVMPAPQATLLAMIAKGVISGGLPYGLVGIGICIGIVMAILRIPVLVFSLGLYLPLSLTIATMLGGAVRAYVNQKSASEEVSERGRLMASGLIGGDACVGVIIAFLAILKIIPSSANGFLPDIAGFVIFLLLALLLGAVALKRLPFSKS